MIDFRRVCCVALFPILVIPVTLPAEGQDSTGINATRLGIVAGAAAGTIAAVHIYQHSAWWQGERAPFRFENDWTYALNIDKMGHTYGGYAESKLARNILGWIGLDERPALVYGSLLGLAYQTYVEVEDGYHQAYGFSPGDEFSDILGASIPLAQEAFPVLKNFSMKFGYYPSSQYLDALKTQKFRVFIDDYEGSVYWICMDPHFLMGEKLRNQVPPWLGVAMGFAVHDLDENGAGRRLYYLTLDYNFSKISTTSDVLKTLFGALDFFHFPAPGIALEDSQLRFGIFYTFHVKATL